MKVERIGIRTYYEVTSEEDGLKYEVEHIVSIRGRSLEYVVYDLQLEEGELVEDENLRNSIIKAIKEI